MGVKFYETRADQDGKYSEYYLEDEPTYLVLRKDFRLVRHWSGMSHPVNEHSEQIEGFIHKEVDPKAKNMLMDFLEEQKKNPGS